MKVLLAGATGAVGLPLVSLLHAAGHHVTGLVRTAAGATRRSTVPMKGSSACSSIACSTRRAPG